VTVREDDIDTVGLDMRVWDRLLVLV
jgi:hypothetical protein